MKRIFLFLLILMFPFMLAYADLTLTEGEGIDIVKSGVGGTVTVSLDTTELGDLTFGAGVPATMAWTFSLSGATDPVATWSNNLLTLSNGLTLTTDKNFIIGTTQWNSGNSIDGTKLASMTSAQLATILSDESGTDKVAFTTSPVFTTPNIGSATGSVSGNAGTVTNGVYTTNNLSVMSATTSAQLYGVLSDETGSASGAPLAVFNQNPTLTGATMAGVFTLGENGIALDPSISGDGYYSGITETGTAGATLAFGDLIYLNNDDSRWELADANLSDGYDKQLGLCVLTAANDGSATTILLYGKINAATAFPAITVGAPAYLSETAGDITFTAPTTTDSATRIIGYGTATDEILFNPENSYYTHT